MKFTNPILKYGTACIALLAVLTIFPACDPFGLKSTGDLVTETFEENDFTGLNICVPASVEVHVGDEFSVEITCEETAMDYLETKVSDGILKIYFDRSMYDVDDMKIVVTAPSWDYFDLSGSGALVVHDSISGQTLDVDVSGSGRIQIDDATFTKAKVRISGSGNIDLSGKADILDCEISGSGNADCLHFPVNTADAHISGSGNMRIYVLEFLDAHISGSGTIEYDGDPQVDKHISGSGKVRKI